MKTFKMHLVAALAVLLSVGALGLLAQRSTATQLQWDPTAGLFHLMANGADYSVQNEITESCGTLTACALTVPVKPITVTGTAAASSATTVTVTALPFTSSTSYVCAASDQTTAANGSFKIANASASSFVLTDTNSNSDTFAYICIGN